jgi:hypothetical protein
MLLCFTLAACTWDWHASDNKLPGTPCGSRKAQNAGRSPTCCLWMADANSHIPCRYPAAALRSRFQKGIFVAQQGNGMVCVSQTWPHCVNQMGKTQSKPLAERHGMCESAFRHTINMYLHDNFQSLCWFSNHPSPSGPILLLNVIHTSQCETEVLTPVAKKIPVSRHTTLKSLVERNHRLGRICYLHL